MSKSFLTIFPIIPSPKTRTLFVNFSHIAPTQIFQQGLQALHFPYINMTIPFPWPHIHILGPLTDPAHMDFCYLNLPLPLDQLFSLPSIRLFAAYTLPDIKPSSKLIFTTWEPYFTYQDFHQTMGTTIPSLKTREVSSMPKSIVSFHRWNHQCLNLSPHSSPEDQGSIAYVHVSSNSYPEPPGKYHPCLNLSSHSFPEHQGSIINV